MQVFVETNAIRDMEGVRVYIHVVDLAKGHTLPLKKIQKGSGLNVYITLTVIKVSVFEIIPKTWKKRWDPIPYRIVERRPQVISLRATQTAKAKAELVVGKEIDISPKCEDAWRWQSKNIQMDLKTDDDFNHRPPCLNGGSTSSFLSGSGSFTSRDLERNRVCLC